MSIAIDTNVLVRILVQDPTAPNQCAAARRLVTDATEAGEPLLVSLCALLETEWVLRSRYRVSRKAMVDAFISMLETPGIEFEHDARWKRRSTCSTNFRPRTSPTAYSWPEQHTWVARAS